MAKTQIKSMFFNSGAASLNAFYSDGLDIAFMGAVPFLIGKSLDVPIKILAIPNISMGGEAIVILKKRKNQDNFKIGTIYGSSAHYLLHRYQYFNPRIFISFMTPELLIRSLESGFIDGISIWDPFKTYAIENFDTEIVYDDKEIGGNINTLVISERFYNSYPNTVGFFLNVLEDANDWINQNRLKANELITTVLNSPDMTKLVFNKHYLQHYNWDFLMNSNDFNIKIERGIMEIDNFIFHSNIGKKVSLDSNNLYISHNNEFSNSNNLLASELRIGYSADIMCAQFLIAGVQNLWDQYGFKIESQNQLLGERILHYDLSVQKELRKILSNMKSNSISSIVGLRAILERSLKHLCVKFGITLDNNKPIGLFKYLELLNNKHVVPKTVLEYSHLIRMFGNESAHKNVKHAPDIRILIELTLRVLDWVYSDSSGNCPNCYSAIESDWQFCSNCGFDLEAIK